MKKPVSRRVEALTLQVWRGQLYYWIPVAPVFGVVACPVTVAGRLIYGALPRITPNDAALCHACVRMPMGFVADGKALPATRTELVRSKPRTETVWRPVGGTVEVRVGRQPAQTLPLDGS